jgi:enterochelin esterase-like enzyme
MNSLRALLCLLVFPAGAAWAQSAPRLISPEVHPDRSVTFRFRDPGAGQVLLALEGAPRAAMNKGADGVWTFTTAALEPDFYGYSFVADGVNLCDPGNPVMKANLLNSANLVHVPGPASLSWEMTDVPHGEIHHHFYHSSVAGDDRDYFVYTPPGYDPAGSERYPTLYLLHGFSDDASGWTAVGRANIILDNLIAWGHAKPMVVVMPLGYGTMEVIAARSNQDPALAARNTSLFQESLLREVLPRVERDYRVERDRRARAIAGLSLGGEESLRVGLNHPETFAWIGSFSAGGLDRISFPEAFPKIAAGAGGQPQLLWIACGLDDRLLDSNRKFRDWLGSKGVRHTDIETPGSHTWMVWRRNLTVFAPLLFRP